MSFKNAFKNILLCDFGDKHDEKDNEEVLSNDEKEDRICNNSCKTTELNSSSMNF